MAKINYPFIDDYIRSKYPDQTGILAELEDYAKDNFIPIIQRPSLELLKLVIKLTGSKNILELGTAIGYSAIAMARLDEEISITSIDRDEEMISLARENIKRAQLGDRITLKLGEIDQVLTGLKGPFDLVFIDAGKSHYIDYFTRSLPLIKEGGLVFSDNILFKGLVADPSLASKKNRTMVRNMRDYVDFITSKKGLTTSLLAVGDGVALSLVEEKE